MKRIVIAVFMLNIIICANSASLQKVFSPQTIKGSAYFPLYVGKVWKWDVFGKEDLKGDTWETTGAYVINDMENNLTNAVAFEVVSGTTNSRWFFLEHDGYICRYEKTGNNNYLLTRVLPVNPSVSDKWVGGSKQYKVKELSEAYVKSEFENESVNKSGYELFKKGIGPVEIFVFLAGENKNSVIYKLRETGGTIKTVSLQPVPGIEDKTPTLVKNLKETREKIDEDVDLEPYQAAEELSLLKKLADNKNYIQVGSFFLKKNASGYLDKVVKSGYNGKIFHDKDGYYKVLLEVEKDTDKLLLNVKNTLSPGAFIKQRIKIN